MAQQSLPKTNSNSKTCSVAGCDRRWVARTWCTHHYGRWRFHGNPNRTPDKSILRRCRHDIAGRTFTFLTAIEYVRHDGRAVWRCKCKCGAVVFVGTGPLLRGHTKSCGCIKPRLKKNFPAEYRIWAGIFTRCYNLNCKAYRLYGGRGITVYEEWRAFPEFLKYVGPRPSKNHSIDRINNDGNYEPGNVRWATKLEQANNTRWNRFLEYDGRRQTIAQWAREVGAKSYTVIERLNRGWDAGAALGLEPSPDK